MFQFIQLLQSEGYGFVISGSWIPSYLNVNSLMCRALELVIERHKFDKNDLAPVGSALASGTPHGKVASNGPGGGAAEAKPETEASKVDPSGSRSGEVATDVPSSNPESATTGNTEVSLTVDKSVNVSRANDVHGELHRSQIGHHDKVGTTDTIIAKDAKPEGVPGTTDDIIAKDAKPEGVPASAEIVPQQGTSAQDSAQDAQKPKDAETQGRKRKSPQDKETGEGRPQKQTRRKKGEAGVHAEALVATPISQVRTRGRLKSEAAHKPEQSIPTSGGRSKSEAAYNPEQSIPTSGGRSKSEVAHNPEQSIPTSSVDCVSQIQNFKVVPSGATYTAMESPTALGSEKPQRALEESPLPPPMEGPKPLEQDAGRPIVEGKRKQVVASGSSQVPPSHLPPAANTRGARGRVVGVPPAELKQVQAQQELQSPFPVAEVKTVLTDKEACASPKNLEVQGKRTLNSSPVTDQATQQTLSANRGDLNIKSSVSQQSEQSAPVPQQSQQTTLPKSNTEPDATKTETVPDSTAASINVSDIEHITPVSSKLQPPHGLPPPKTRSAKRKSPAVLRTQPKRGRPLRSALVVSQCESAPESSTEKVGPQKDEADISNLPQTSVPQAPPSTVINGEKEKSGGVLQNALEQGGSGPQSSTTAAPSVLQSDSVPSSSARKSRARKEEDTNTPPVKGVFLTRSKLRMLAAASGTEASGAEVGQEVASTIKEAGEAGKNSTSLATLKQAAAGPAKSNSSSKTTGSKKTRQSKKSHSAVEEVVTEISTQTRQALVSDSETGLTLNLLNEILVKN